MRLCNLIILRKHPNTFQKFCIVIIFFVCLGFGQETISQTFWDKYDYDEEMTCYHPYLNTIRKIALRGKDVLESGIKRELIESDYEKKRFIFVNWIGARNAVDFKKRRYYSNINDPVVYDCY